MMAAILMIAYSVAGLEIHESETRIAYMNFIAQHGKSYASLGHMENRYEVFKANYIDV